VWTAIGGDRERSVAVAPHDEVAAEQSDRGRSRSDLAGFGHRVPRIEKGRAVDEDGHVVSGRFEAVVV
jgi:hypothetical protein